MEKWNGSAVTEFILLGLDGNSYMRIAHLMIFLVIYSFTLYGNISLVTLCVLEPRLHTPMYFFLVNLSVLDLLYSSVIVPNMVVHFLQDRWIITFSGCAAQLCAYLQLACTEGVLLAVMAYDRYVAICFPLHYTNIMNSSSCLKMAAGCWLNGLLMAIPVTIFTLKLPLCGNNVINNFFCEAVTLIKMACVETTAAEMVIFSAGIIVLLIPSLVILFCYVHIIVAILRIRSTEGRSKAFSTCASHLTVVSMMYAPAIFMYMKPMAKNPDKHEKLISVFYTVVPPVLNPIIYSLRNKEIKTALHNVTTRWCEL